MTCPAIRVDWRARAAPRPTPLMTPALANADPLHINVSAIASSHRRPSTRGLVGAVTDGLRRSFGPPWRQTGRSIGGQHRGDQTDDGVPATGTPRGAKLVPSSAERSTHSTAWTTRPRRRDRLPGMWSARDLTSGGGVHGLPGASRGRSFVAISGPLILQAQREIVMCHAPASEK